MNEKLTTIKNTFENTELVTITYKGQPCWIAQEVGRALGYENGSDLTKLVRREWSEELEEGTEYTVLRGRELKQFKELVPLSVSESLSRVPNLMLLFQSGINEVCLKTTKPLGVKLRRFLAREVLPEIQATGGYGSGLSGSAPNKTDAFIERVRAADAYLASLRANVELTGRAYAQYAAQAAFHRLGGPEPTAAAAEDVKVSYLTVSGYLKSKGLPRATIKRIRSEFGVRLKAAYVAEVGHEPKTREQDVDGYPAEVCVYTVEHRHLFDQVFKAMKLDAWTQLDLV